MTTRGVRANDWKPDERLLTLEEVAEFVLAVTATFLVMIAMLVVLSLCCMGRRESDAGLVGVWRNSGVAVIARPTGSRRNRAHQVP